MHSNPRAVTTLRRVQSVLLLTASALVLAGCASSGGPGAANGAMPGPGAANGSQVGQTQGQGQGEAVARGLRGIPPEDRAKFKNPDNPLSTRVIHFAFDSSNIPSRYADVIRAHAQYLGNHPQVHLRIEGHTDKRGTREYNIALGARRAKSVKHALVISGASSGQISTLSFGEERPVAMGDTKEAYAKNRRAVLIYTK